jgi:hypothetical protein
MESSAGDGGGGGEKAQTRFNFYNAEEVHKATSLYSSHFELSSNNKEQSANDRFPISTADEIHKTAPLSIPKPIDLTSLGAKSDNEWKSDVEPIDVLPDDSTSATQNILRSLQETEREQQKVKIGGSSKASLRRFANRQQSNPYEAAIHDALAMLRSGRAKQQQQQPQLSAWKDLDEKGDKILESREAVFSEIREAERRGRELRMAKYAAKLVELEGRPVPAWGAAFSALEEAEHAPLPPVDQSQKERMFRARVDDKELDEVAKLEQTFSTAEASQASVEVEVQRGVERVLMAILNRAQSRDDAARDRMDSNDDLTKALSTLLHPGPAGETDTPRVKPPSRRLAEEFLSEDEGDDDDEEENIIESDDEVNVSQGSTHRRSVAEELLADDGSENDLKTTPPLMEMATSPQTTFSRVTVEHSPGDDDEVDVTALSDFAAIAHNDEDEVVRRATALTQVLGPLSGNDTTGVVLENSDTVIDDFDESDDEVAAVTSQGPSILESLSSVVKDAENFMSYMAGAVSPSNSCSNPDKYLIQNGGNDDAETSLDAEANELMRSLCAHLLPYGVDKSTKHLSEIPPWDDRNPNEPGYRIIRLSKSQLRRVEAEFERMVNGVKLSSERDLGNTRLAEGDMRNAWNGVAATSYDKNFEKDLEEAENLLDREEKQRAVAEKDKALSNDESDGDETGPSEVSVSEADETTLSCHPDFPGVRRSGKGEMGDLEYFSLPIIFKSHVTGFEPTKDLYLEPGNVVAGQYLVENELGSAAFSTAYRCIDLNSDVSGDGDVSEFFCQA